jgi:hypothetical protein
MSANPREVSPQLVVVPPTRDSNQGPILWLQALPAWVVSGVLHAALLFLLLHVTVASGDSPADHHPLEAVVLPEREETVVDLTEPTIGLDPLAPAGWDAERIEDVTVRAPLDPAIEPGASAQPTEMVRIPGPGTGPAGAAVVGFAEGPLPGLPGLGGLAPGGFAGRTSGATRQQLLDANGGNKASEAAVARGLLWLARHQAADGRWSLHAFPRDAHEIPAPGGKTFICDCGGRATRQNDTAATAFGLLPFLGAGLTHKVPPKGGERDYSKTVAAGLRYLMTKQGKDGYFGGDMYSHGLASIALCEAYGLTADPMLKLSAQRALNFIATAQDPAGGGWRYSPRTPGDLSVTGWQIMALKSGQMAGLSVPREIMRKAEQFLDACESNKKGGYGYVPGVGETITMTAVGLLCRQYMGFSPRNPGLLAGVERLKKALPNSPAGQNLYYVYYATQVMHHMGGEAWQLWNLGPAGDGKGGMRDALLEKQEQKGHTAGSWPPDAAFREQGGRMMSTSLSLLTLEVYYRHLPLYRRDMGVNKDGK